MEFLNILWTICKQRLHDWLSSGNEIFFWFLQWSNPYNHHEHGIWFFSRDYCKPRGGNSLRCPLFSHYHNPEELKNWKTGYYQIENWNLKLQTWNLKPNAWYLKLQEIIAIKLKFETQNLKPRIWNPKLELWRNHCSQIEIWNSKSETWNLRPKARHLKLEEIISIRLKLETWNLKPRIWNPTLETWRNHCSQIEIWNSKSETWNLKPNTWFLKLEEIIAIRLELKTWNLKPKCQHLTLETWRNHRHKILMSVNHDGRWKHDCSKNHDGWPAALSRVVLLLLFQMISPCCPVSLILLWAFFSATGDAELDQKWLLRL